MGKTQESPSGPNNSPQLNIKFSEQQREPDNLIKAKEVLGTILGTMDDQKFAKPVAEMLYAINATTKEIMRVKEQIQAANKDLDLNIKMGDLAAKREKGEYVLKNVA